MLIKFLFSFSSAVPSYTIAVFITFYFHYYRWVFLRFGCNLKWALHTWAKACCDDEEGKTFNFSFKIMINYFQLFSPLLPPMHARLLFFCTSVDAVSFFLFRIQKYSSHTIMSDVKSVGMMLLPKKKWVDNNVYAVCGYYDLCWHFICFPLRRFFWVLSLMTSSR